ncbi:Serine/threonine-protein kinase PrkC [Arthrobacter saudimassiliensis]|uniref:non-specific serine/threonine protein kinase n=1 Tax=Arthrobacter saudimassiliensis TaxID=1461584 RepID=A0A078MRM5_9MICC|nr:Serine/threonine-protein kinase PrkC [Arthrobacter saudimassiliensis]
MPRHMGAGTVLGGRYRLVERIGSGSMGAVHRAVDEFLDREVAVKLIASTARTEEQRRSDEAEAKLLARLSHHSLITLFDAGTDVSPSGTSIVWLAMELVHGPDLSRRLSQGRLHSRQVAFLGYDLAIGLDYMHRSSIVHRDIKPANILLFDYRDDESRLRAKLTDFGVAQLAGDPHPEKGQFTGTAGFMSPEQARGEAAGPQSDVYSLGLVLLQCLTGERAFPGPALESALSRLFRSPEIPDWLDPDWAQLLRAMTALDPWERPSAHDASEVLADMASAGRGRRRAEDPASAEEQDRLQALGDLDVIDRGEDPTLERLASLTARLLNVPVAAVSMVGRDKVWTIAGAGTERGSAPLESSLCPVTVRQDGPFIVDDVQNDPRTSDDELVRRSPGFGFYAGVPLRDAEGRAVGTLCVMDRRARSLTGEQEATLKDLAAVVMDVLMLRSAAEQARTVGRS